jgi:hypothetical protein
MQFGATAESLAANRDGGDEQPHRDDEQRQIADDSEHHDYIILHWSF